MLHIQRRLRRSIIGMAGHSAHVACSLSCVDIIAAVYLGVMNKSESSGGNESDDMFILSKGHGAMALYAVLAEAKVIDYELLATYATDGSPLAEHPLAAKVPGIEFATGSLGHGLALGAGVAKGRKLQHLPGRVFVLLGDGECDEGSVWEAASAALAHSLDNLTAVIDWNGFQACGTLAEISPNGPLSDKWRGFGWEVEEIDGHDFAGLQKALSQPPTTGRPKVVLGRTIKGKGVPFMEGNLEWHYRPVRGEERTEALRWLQDA